MKIQDNFKDKIKDVKSFISETDSRTRTDTAILAVLISIDEQLKIIANK